MISSLANAHKMKLLGKYFLKYKKQNWNTNKSKNRLIYYYRYSEDSHLVKIYQIIWNLSTLLANIIWVLFFSFIQYFATNRISCFFEIRWNKYWRKIPKINEKQQLQFWDEYCITFLLYLQCYQFSFWSLMKCITSIDNLLT